MRVLAVLNEGAETGCSEFRISFVGSPCTDAWSPHGASSPGDSHTRVPLLHRGEGVVVGGTWLFPLSPAVSAS